MSDEITRTRILVRGSVQGVGYRAFVVHAAARHQLRGRVRNLDDGRVEVEAEGPRDRMESLIAELRVGPPAARVAAVDVEWKAPTGGFADFRIWY